MVLFWAKLSVWKNKNSRNIEEFLHGNNRFFLIKMAVVIV
jgi:hypothetical protein